jgi:alpha-L-fucosidase
MQSRIRCAVLALTTLLTSAIVSGAAAATDCPPRPKELLSDIPKPSVQQIRWQRSEMVMFLHFGVCTFLDCEWGLGNEDPNVFQPAKLWVHSLAAKPTCLRFCSNSTQWVSVAQAAGFNELILVAKHHDGFQLFPSSFTNHSVKSSSWRNYKGDVVADFTRSCSQLGMNAAFYLSPW